MHRNDPDPQPPVDDGPEDNWGGFRQALRADPPMIDDDPHDGDPPPENPIYS